ncbi:DNA-3-methyladenine glycosylase 2 family protein [Ilumatobacter sp.]|uniref:DNA-3-methyladenine glycosylase 2 family protein n=1 Tax=Ilumatobacter sp. TaxID=1967498 RepID=UPI003B5278AF
MPPLDDDRCYAAASSRDARFDGTFVVAVRSTGIYCRPSCPAITPKRENVEFHLTTAAAQGRGFRACKRCAPDAAPGSAEWNVRTDVAGRAMRLIADGVVERDGVAGLAARLGYSERHLHRVLTAEVGAGTLALARARRAHGARTLVETTAMTFTDVAFAAGFGSVRQFNDTVREVYAATPSELRRAARSRPARGPSGVSRGATATAGAELGGATSVTLRLPTRAPFAARHVLDFVARRAVPGVESAPDRSARVRAAPHVGAAAGEGPGAGLEPDHRRILSLPGGPGSLAVVAAADDHLAVTLRLTAWSDLAAAVQRVRRMFDLDADPVAIDDHLGADPVLAALVEGTPGLRSPGSVDAFETIVRAVIGQQVSVAGARTVAGRLVAHAGVEVPPDLAIAGGPTRSFPTASAVADAPDDAFAMPHRRSDTIRRVAAAFAGGDLVVDPGSDPGEVRARLLEIAGIGPWTADYVVMRALGHPDVMLDTDLVVRRALVAHGRPSTQRWSPWRSYAVHHLWAAAGPRPEPPAAPVRGGRPGRRPPATAAPMPDRPTDPDAPGGPT